MKTLAIGALCMMSEALAASKAGCRAEADGDAFPENGFFKI